MAITSQSPAKGHWLAFRPTPGAVLLVLGYVCWNAAHRDSVLGRFVPSFGLSMWMGFVFAWLFPLAVIPIAVYQFVRYRSLQSVLEIGLALWLLVKALESVVNAA